MKEINDGLYFKLLHLGIISNDDENGNKDDTRTYNIGNSDYSKHTIQPWSIWLDWNLNAWDADIIKRVLRTKCNVERSEDYLKIIHICKERLRQLEIEGNEIGNFEF